MIIISLLDHWTITVFNRIDSTVLALNWLNRIQAIHAWLSHMQSRQISSRKFHLPDGTARKKSWHWARVFRFHIPPTEEAIVLHNVFALTFVVSGVCLYPDESVLPQVGLQVSGLGLHFRFHENRTFGAVKKINVWGTRHSFFFLSFFLSAFLHRRGVA